MRLRRAHRVFAQSGKRANPRGPLASRTPTATRKLVSPSPRLRAALLSALPPALAFLVYASTIGYGFVWDDRTIVERWLPASRGLHAVFLPPAQLDFASLYYRPLVTASYLYDEWLGRGAPWAFHLSVVVAHVLVTFLVFRLGKAIGLGEIAAALGAALFAVHPIHTESVAWMAGRSDVLACLFLLASMLALWRWRGAGGALLSSILLLTAMLTKEVAVISAALLPAAALLLALTSLRRSCAVVGAALAPYVVLRLAAGASGGGGGWSPHALSDVLALPGYYAAGLLAPLHANPLVEDLQPWGLFAAGTLAVGLAAGVYLARARADARVRFLLLWIGIALTPALLPALVPGAVAPFAERYLYLPSVGFCLLAAEVAVRLAARRRVVWAAALLLLALAGVATSVRNRAWRDGISFWDATAASNPDSWRAWNGLGKAHAEAGLLAEAEAAYSRALAFAEAKGRAVLLNNLGDVYRRTERPFEAEASYRAAAALDSHYAEPLYNLGLQYWTRGREAKSRGDAAAAQQSFDEARRLLEQVLTIDPYLAPAHYALGALGALTNYLDLARIHLEATIRLAPNSQEATFARQVVSQLHLAAPAGQ
jgi:protein O-mannosyl-transferase